MGARKVMRESIWSSSSMEDFFLKKNQILRFQKLRKNLGEGEGGSVDYDLYTRAKYHVKILCILALVKKRFFLYLVVNSTNLNRPPFSQKLSYLSFLLLSQYKVFLDEKLQTYISYCWIHVHIVFIFSYAFRKIQKRPQ